MKQKKSIIIATVLSLAGIGVLASCGGGDTDGGAATSDSGNGTQYVSDGGSGSTLRIELEGSDTIPTGGRVNFKVTAIDPSGSPLSFIRVNCETEHGIAIIEPSRGGVAFETTNSDGKMSGVLGGVSPGSFLIECRAPQGYNLVARKHYKVVGEVPEGFAGFPGAAGGNLGGGVIVEPVNEDVTLTEVKFTSVSNSGGSRVGDIDNFLDSDCDNDITTVDPEPFGPDNFEITVNNQRDDRVFIESVVYKVDLPGFEAVSLEELAGLVIASKSTVPLVGPFTEVIGSKNFVGTLIPTPTGTFNVTFTVTMVTGTGETIVATQAGTVRIGPFDYC